jgi:hypothetical protein
MLSYILLFAGLFITGFTIYYFRKRFVLAKQSHSWPKVKGSIISEATQENTDHKGKAAASTQQVKYNYIVGQKRYTATRISFFGHIRFSFLMPEKPQRYWRGQNVDVYYDPSAHHVSVLQPGMQMYSVVPLLVPFVFGIGLMIYSFFI